MENRELENEINKKIKEFESKNIRINKIPKIDTQRLTSFIQTKASFKNTSNFGSNLIPKIKKPTEFNEINKTFWDRKSTRCGLLGRKELDI